MQERDAEIQAQKAQMHEMSKAGAVIEELKQ